MDRRTFLQVTGLAALGMLAGSCGEPAPQVGQPTAGGATSDALSGGPASGGVEPVGFEQYTLPQLPYAYDALEPHIDAQTMQLHHDVHHAGYVKGLNAAIVALAALRDSGDEAALKAQIKPLARELAFHGSGHFLHTIFWRNMGPGKGGRPADSPLARAIDAKFGSFDRFQAQFGAAAKAVEGSGWALLVKQPDGALEILESEVHHNLTQQVVTPILALDVWEHAYYLKYQNKRAAYVDAWWNVVNWDDVAARYEM